jgi:CHAT domain-containing protein/tetratricopeptide (TPR) repeat protein
MNNEPNATFCFIMLCISGLVAYGFRTLGMWADGGDYSVLEIMIGAPPEFTWRSNIALLCYGIAISCLGIALGFMAVIARATVPGTRVGTLDVLAGRRHPSEAAGQFRRYGWIIMLATLLVLSGPLLTAVFFIWHVVGVLAARRIMAETVGSLLPMLAAISTIALAVHLLRKGVLRRPIERLRVPWLLLQLHRAMALQSLPQIIAVTERLVATNETILGPDHPALASHLNMLACLYREAANPKAMACLERALEIAEKWFSPTDPRRAVILSNLGGMFRQVGMPDRARQYYRQAMEIDKLVYGEFHPECATDANNIAVTYMMERSYAKARPWYNVAMNIDLAVYGPWHHVVAQDCSNWSALLAAEHDFAGAEDFCRRGLNVLETHWPNFTVQIAEELIALAWLVKAKGSDYHQEARCLLERALELDRKALGENHIDVARDFLFLAELEASHGNTAQAIEFISKTLPSQAKIINAVLGVTTEQQRLAFLRQFQPALDLYLSLAGKNLELVPSAHDLVVSRKGLTLEVGRAQREALLAGAYPSLLPVFRQLRQSRMEMTRHLLSGPRERGGANSETHARKLGELEKRCEKLEWGIARQVSEVMSQRKLRGADRRAVALSLPKDSLLVDFVRFDPYRFEATGTESRWGDARYLAFMLPATDTDDGLMIDLGEAKRIDAAIAMFRDQVIGPTRASDEELQESTDSALLEVCRELHTRLFLPLKRSLGAGNGKRLFLSPDSELNLLPFEALLSEEGKFVVEEYRLSYVATARDVLRFGEQNGEPRDALIVADPDFNLCEKHSSAQSEDASRGLQEILTEREHPRSRDFRSEVGVFEPLPLTREEGEQIAEMLRSKGVAVCRLWFDRDALEEPLKAVRSPMIMHLATHGFFERDQEHKPDEGLRGLGVLRSGESGFLPLGIENPLLRSGLALAGANTLFLNMKPAPMAEDGILTALDVCGLNLFGTELVTLSACDTGVGEVRRGEGVFGLRRAFQQAGAKTLVMSLWQVADDETQMLMQHFYRNLFAGLPKPDALREAQLHIIREMRSRNIRPDLGFAHPFFWAAFICQGDPAPLQLPL